MPTLASDLVKSVLVPGSMTFFAIAVACGVLLLYVPRLHAWGRRWLLLLVLVYLALATPIVSATLRRVAIRPAYPPLERVEDAGHANAVVVLGNGAFTYTHGRAEIPTLTQRTAFNVMEGARLYRMLGQPRVILSGGIVDPTEQRRSEAELMAQAIVSLGVPRASLTLDSTSRNTFEQSVQVARLLPSGARFVLVTTPIHMPRTMALFQARGLSPIAAPSPIDYDGGSVLPNESSLHASELVIYEHLARVNGWARGWFSASPQ